MYSRNEYQNLVKNYGSFASWAIWDYKNEKNPSIIAQNFDQLHSRFIFLGLNISGSLNNVDWINFHGGIHDRKLKFAANETKLRGAYITDLFKDISEAQSSKIDKLLTKGVIDKNVQSFRKEMKAIRIVDDSHFIIFGEKAKKYFDEFFKQHFIKNKFTYYTHYSYYGIKDKKWVEGFWDKLNLNQDYEQTISKYNK